MPAYESGINPRRDTIRRMRASRSALIVAHTGDSRAASTSTAARRAAGDSCADVTTNAGFTRKAPSMSCSICIRYIQLVAACGLPALHAIRRSAASLSLSAVPSTAAIAAWNSASTRALAALRSSLARTHGGHCATPSAFTVAERNDSSYAASTARQLLPSASSNPHADRE